MAALNYAVHYQQALEQNFPYVLYFGALYSTPNNGRFKWVNAKTIEIPSITTTGRVDSDRDTIQTASRNYDNSWEPKTLTNQRKWSTLVHPADVDQTNQVASIQNITRTYNDEQKFPEMDCYTISKIFADWTEQGEKESTTVLTEENILKEFDAFMQSMDEARVPGRGRILYVTPAINTIIKNAKEITRTLNLNNNNATLKREVSRIDEVEIVPVPPELMKTKYDFTRGWKPTEDARQIRMVLIHPLAVITPISYQFSQLDPPSAGSEGKWVYFEESYEDVFILNKKKKAICFNVEAAKTDTSAQQGG